MQRIALTVQEEVGFERRAWPVTRGVPLPRGVAAEPEALWLADAQGQGVSLQSHPLSRWPDGSIKWVLVDFQADVPAAGQAVYYLCCGGERRDAQAVLRPGASGGVGAAGSGRFCRGGRRGVSGRR